MGGRAWHRAGVAALGTLALVAAPLLVVVAATPADALTVITVTTPTDAALRAAFTTANGTADDVEIDINVGAGPINLSAGELLYNGGGGNFALTVKGNGVTINQGTVGARVFDSTSTGLLTLDGMTITGGNVSSPSGAGGAVDALGAITITNSTVSNNTAVSTATGGNNGADIFRVGAGTTGAFNATNLTLTSNMVTGTGASPNRGLIDTGVTTITSSNLSNNTSLAATGSADGVLDTTNVTVTGTTINGNTETSTGGTAFGIFDTTTTTVSGSTVSGNTVTASGTGTDDGIFDTSATTVSGSTISGNTDRAAGTGAAEGRLFPSGLTMTDSQVVGNTTHAAGTGQADGTIDASATVLTRSSVTGNTNSTVAGAAFGGLDVSSVTATNSTISNNTSSGVTSEGGGIDDGPGSAGKVAAKSDRPDKHGGGHVSAEATAGTTLVYATVTGNAALTGANVRSSKVLTAFGSVVAQPSGGVNCVLAATTVSNGWNFSDDATCGFTNTANGDRQNAGDPGLAALANNGGPGPTRLPQLGSPLIDAIPAASCQADGASGITTDERSFPRPDSLSPNCDIGAVEVGPSATALVVQPRFTG